MKTRVRPISALSTAALALAVLSSPAQAQVVDSGHFVDEFEGQVPDDVYLCQFTDDPADGGVLAVDSGRVRVNFMLNQRGSGSFPYYRETVHGTVVTTNIETGGTFTQVFSNNFHDHVITDNGDGTITITVYAAGGTRFYDQNGKFVLKDPGAVRYAFDVDYNDTPGDPSDDTEVEDSFRIVRSSTGNSDFSDRNFCEDLLTFTS
ncbi:MULTISPECIES: hypothetical protein [unclassified Nocardioides]|uniref:hypothetical protein n=1 Tax=unclassified Nocardioides TaxID=2615069 RepID=UPI00361640DB